METVGERRLWSFSDQNSSITKATCTAVRTSGGFKVESFLDMAKRVAELQFRNRDLVLMFRGQTGDYKNKLKNTSLRPSMFRTQDSAFQIQNTEFNKRYSKLRDAEKALLKAYETSELPDLKILRRQQIIRWSILQHYEVCSTPMLDITHSLRIAASFASLDAPDEAYVMVVGVPNLSGVITTCADAGLQIIRLSGVCPPAAVRPHIQEGYLLAVYPEMSEIDHTQHYKLYEIDFGRRLVAKFKFNPEEFWKKSPGFPRIERDALYPQDDPMLQLTNEIRRNLEGPA